MEVLMLDATRNPTSTRAIMPASTEPPSGAADDCEGWREIHRRVVRVAGAKAALDEEQGRLMLEALRADVHSHLGYATFIEYVERLFGLGPRETEERLRVARRSRVCLSWRRRCVRHAFAGRRCVS